MPSELQFSNNEWVVYDSVLFYQCGISISFAAVQSARMYILRGFFVR